MKSLKAHIFVCTNERPSSDTRGCCLQKGSEKILEELKTEISKKGLKIEVRAQRAGCLDTCAQGPSMVIYPEGIWYEKVTLQDVPEIVEKHLLQGKPIERLKMKGK